MPALTAGQLTTLRTHPHRSRLFLVVQQPEWRESGAWTGYDWSCRINGAPAGTPGDLVASLTVDTGGAAVTLLDGCTVFIDSSEYGGHDRGIFVIRGDQTVGPATVTLNIQPSSEIVSVVQNNDYVVVLDEHRLWTRYPRVTEAAGVISWFKDYDVTWNSLAFTDAQRRQATIPAIPVMGPHHVRFITPGTTEDIAFDGSNSYANYPGAVINWYLWNGERDSGAWNSNLAQPNITYQSTDISGLAGYRVELEIATTAVDPPSRFVRGIRYVFTLRRPGETQVGDPTNAEPIVDFSLDSLEGSIDEGGWTASITVFDSQASELEILEGALVVLFADDWYGDTQTSVGPIEGHENIIFIGRIADGSVRQDPETGDVSFEVQSAGAGIAKNREMYPIPIENDDGADDWIYAPDLTVDKAAIHYIVFHSTLATICDFYKSNDTEEIKAMDFLAGDIYSVLDSFYSDRLFARMLSDRYERVAAYIDRQMGVAAAGTTIFTLATGDWLEELIFREEIEDECSIVELGGLNYNAGLITPYLCKAPGTVNRVMGKGDQNTNMAIASQATLNTLSGRRLAWLNCQWPEGTIPLGNWRAFDIWPQEYINVSETTVRHTFSSDLFIPRSVRVDYEGDAIFVTPVCEMETDGVAGQTIDIPDELPVIAIPNTPTWGPAPPAGGDEDGGRRILAAPEGVYFTDNVGATNPLWIAANSGLSTSDDLNVWDIKRDPWHWWTSDGAERSLWAATRSGVWRMENFPYGTWVNEVTLAAINAACGTAYTYIQYARITLSIEVEGRLALVFYYPGGFGAHRYWALCIQDEVIQNATQLGVAGNYTSDWPDIRFAPHSAGEHVYAIRGHVDPFNGNLLYKTTTFGTAGWSQIEQLATGFYAALSVPYVDVSNPDRYVFWGGEDREYRISVDRGVSFSDLSGSSGFSKIGTGGHPDYIWLLSERPDLTACKYSVDRGVTYTGLPVTPISIQSYSSWVKWESGMLQSALIAGMGTAGASGPYIYRWTGGPSWADKRGNIDAYSITDFRQIQRDSMGSA